MFASEPSEINHYCPYAKFEDYLNRADVRKAIHVAPSVLSLNWTICNYEQVVHTYRQEHDSMAPVFRDILEKHNFTNVVVYSGTTDELCDFVSTQLFLIHKLGFRLKEPTKAWLLNGSFAGMASRFENGLRFYTIHGAGHMAPTQKPVESMSVFKDMLGLEKIV